MPAKPQIRARRAEAPLAAPLLFPRRQPARRTRHASQAQAGAESNWRWAAARVGFFAYVFISMFSVVGGFLTAPLMTWYFYGDWRVWKHWDSCRRLYLHSWKMAWLVLRRDQGSFMFSVPLASAPVSAPSASLVRLAPTWEHGSSCGPCSRCCQKIACPILDTETGQCRGYDSFFWRYFNCGRFPSAQPEIDYYGCPKWEMRPSLQAHGLLAARDNAQGGEVELAAQSSSAAE